LVVKNGSKMRGTSGDGNYARTERMTTGVVGGADLAAGETARIGVPAGYTKGRTDLSARASRAEIETVHLGLYGSAEAGPIALRAGAFWATGHADTRRAAAYGTASENERARYDITTWQSYAEAGYRVGFRGGALEPFANFTVLGMRRGSFTETGGAAALTGAARTDTLGLSMIGFHFETGVDGPVSVKASLGWRHAFGDRGGSATAGLAGGPAFTVLGAEIAKDAAVLEAGLNWRVGKGATVGAGYDGNFGKGYAHSAKAASRSPFDTELSSGQWTPTPRAASPLQSCRSVVP
jgi:outer membrane autotransporter protein